VFVGGSAAEPRLSATFTVDGSDIPPRDPARPLPAADNDDSAGVVLVDASTVDGDAVRATEPGAWVAFHDVDLDAGPPACRLTVARAAPGPAGVTLRLDDPLGGPVLATVRAACPGGRYGWHPVAAAVPAVRGRRDLYVVFDEPDTCLRDLAFVTVADD
jgi:beta-glucosidase